jgi:cell division septation protein DedD
VRPEIGDTIRPLVKKDRREKNLTAPASPHPAADPKRRTRHRLLLALVLIGLAIAGLAVVERFRGHPEFLPPPHEPSQALIAPPPPASEPVAAALHPPPAALPPLPLVINEADKPAPPPATVRNLPPPASDSAAYLVQAGVFTSPANARSLQQRLAKAGIRAKVETRVQLGPYKDKQEAEQAVTKLKKLGVNAMMVPAR